MTSPSMWSDLPRRLTTISLGVPIILYILAYKRTALVFFQGVHFLSSVEWVQLSPSLTPSDENNVTKYLFVAVSMIVSQLSNKLDTTRNRFGHDRCVFSDEKCSFASWPFAHDGSVSRVVSSVSKLYAYSDSLVYCLELRYWCLGSRKDTSHAISKHSFGSV